jgi:pimeloyl-ACP methyl ester carboxylesterase
MTDASTVATAPRRHGYRDGETLSLDGTRIAFYATDPPRVGAKTVVLAPGLGAPRQAWDPIVEYLADRYRIVTWDYRGLYGSERPRAAGPDAFSIEKHAEDLERVLAATGTASAAIVGWSIGGQVALESYRRDPSRVASLVLVNGTFGRPHELASAGVWALDRARPAMRLALRFPGASKRLLAGATRRPSLTTWLQRLGVLGITAHESGLDELVRRVGGVDVDAFVHNLEAIGRHDAGRILPGVRVPVLVITGDHDVVTSHGLSQRMVRRLPRAELVVVPGGTHFTPLEFPELVALRIERFFRDHGFAP